MSLLLEHAKGSAARSARRAKGYSLDEIEAARKRLKRHIEAVVRQWPAPAETDERRAP